MYYCITVVNFCHRLASQLVKSRWDDPSEDRLGVYYLVLLSFYSFDTVDLVKLAHCVTLNPGYRS